MSRHQYLTGQKYSLNSVDELQHNYELAKKAGEINE